MDFSRTLNRIAPRPGRWLDTRGGSVLEVLVAMMVLSFGIAGLAGTTAVVVKETTQSKIRNEKTAAAQTISERLRSMPFDSVGNGSGHVGDYVVSWTVTSTTVRAKRVQIVTQGVASQGRELQAMSVLPADTFTYTILR